MLIVVHNRNFALRFEFGFDFETFRRFDVFQINASECRLKAFNNPDKLIRIRAINLNVKHIDAGKFLEQHAFSFHHRLGSQGSDVSQTQHSGSV